MKYIYLPTGDGGKKTGLDDFFAAGHTVTDMMALSSSELRAPPTKQEAPAEYCETPDGLVWNKPTKDGTIPTRLTNFNGHIVAEVLEDDGVEQKRVYELLAEWRGGQKRFSVPASEFGLFNWVAEELGANAIIFPGFAGKDRIRVAIQLNSGIPY